MTPILINCHLDSNGHGLSLNIVSEQSLHLAQYIDILEGWIAANRKKFEKEIKEFEDLQKSGKLVSMSKWKKKDGP